MLVTDDLLAPGREVEVTLKLALRGHRGAARTLVGDVRRLLDAEERWLLPELRKLRSPWVDAELARHAEAHDRIRAVVEQLAMPGITGAQAIGVLRVLDALLTPHRRAERELFERVLADGRLEASAGVIRFARHAAPPISIDSNAVVG